MNDRIAELLATYEAPNVSAAELVCDRHDPERLAWTLVDDDLAAQQLTYGDLRRRSEQFAAGLAARGIKQGDRVAILMGKGLDYLTALVAIWRLGAVQVPLFTAFAPPAIEMRIDASGAVAVICDTTQRPKLAGLTTERLMIVSGHPTEPTDVAFEDLLLGVTVSTARLGPDAPIIHIFTSGTTGKPKGVIVPTKALAGFHAYVELGLDVRQDDLYWCAADPGWAYGLYFGILGTLTTGSHGLLHVANFRPESCLAVLDRYPVTNFTAAPTVYRSLRASGLPVPVGVSLRCASSAGEPLTPEVNDWTVEALGVAVHDHYGQTEAGMLINNHHHPTLARPLRVGSMGQAMPGWTGVVLRDDRDEVAPAGTQGRIAFDCTTSPLAWFQGYDGDPTKTAEKFTADRRYYLTGDAGRLDEEGYFYFSARDDDVIIMAGYRIGPFDVESVLLTHPAIAECAVIAVPDDVRGEVIEAFVVLRADQPSVDDLQQQLQELVKRDYAAHAYPRRVHVVDMLPKTPSGKIQRFVLRAQRREELSMAASS